MREGREREREREIKYLGFGLVWCLCLMQIKLHGLFNAKVILVEEN